jgi:hypothetical protein
MHVVNTRSVYNTLYLPFPVQMHVVNTQSVYNTLYLPFLVQMHVVEYFWEFPSPPTPSSLYSKTCLNLTTLGPAFVFGIDRYWMSNYVVNTQSVYNTLYLPFLVQMHVVNTRSVYNTLYLPFPVQVQAVNTRSVSASLQRKVIFFRVFLRISIPTYPLFPIQ